MATSSLETAARTFAHSYATLFASPRASKPEEIPALAQEISQHYRPGLTVFTNGDIQRFETRQNAAKFIASEMQKNTTTGLGTCLKLKSEEVRVEKYSASAATVYLSYKFEPAKGSEYEGKGWEFMDIYGYRADVAGKGEGWEYIVRDQEIESIREVTGKDFL